MTQRECAYFSIAMIPFLVMLAVVLNFTVNVPHWEEWTSIVRLFQLYAEHPTDLLADLWFEGGEHLVFMPRLLLFVIGIASDLNMSYAHVANVFLLGLGFVFIARALSESQDIKYLPAISAVYFSLAPGGVLLWGLSMYIFLTTTCILIGFYYLTRRVNATSISVVFVCGLIACMSNISGLLLPLLAMFYCLSNKTLFPAAIFGIQLIIFVLVLISRGTGELVQELFVNGFFSFAQFILHFVGSPLAVDNTSAAFVFGVLAVVITFFVLHRHGRALLRDGNTLGQNDRFFLLIMLFVLGTALITAIGREATGQSGMTDRYRASAGLFWVAAMYFLRGAPVFERVTRDFLNAVVFGLLVCSILTSLFYLREVAAMSHSRELALSSLLSGENRQHLNSIYRNAQSAGFPEDLDRFLWKSGLGPEVPVGSYPLGTGWAVATSGDNKRYADRHRWQDGIGRISFSKVSTAGTLRVFLPPDKDFRILNLNLSLNSATTDSVMLSPEFIENLNDVYVIGSGVVVFSDNPFIE